jgi:SAM-dependent methyltransferase
MDRAEYDVMAAVEAQHWWYGGMRSVAAALLDPLYRYRRNLRILDAGCGTGGNAIFLQRYGTVVGIDLSPEALAYGEERLPGTLARGSVLSLPFADNAFDLVTSFDVLYHRAVEDEVAALRETHRVLAPLGRLLIRLPAYEFLRSKHDRAVHTRRRYTASETRALLTEAGFQVEYCTYVNSLLFPLPLVQRLLERVAPAVERNDSDLTLPSPLLNGALRVPMALESAWVAQGGSFPFGLSVVALAHSNKYETIQVRPRRRSSRASQPEA